MNETRDVRVAVIEAGIAGLNAAQALKRQGMSPVVFEARNRAVGRVLTVSVAREGSQSFLSDANEEPELDENN